LSKTDSIGVDTKEVWFFGARIPLWLIGVIIVVVVFTGGMGAGFKIKGLDFSDLWGVGEECFVGGVDFSVDESDWQANTAAAPTSPAFSLYYGKPGASSVGKPIAAAGSTITVDGSGTVWLDLYGGTDFYMIPDYSVMKSVNPKCTNLVIEDYDGDGVLDYLASFDVCNVGKTGQGVNPTFDITFPLLDQDTTGLTLTAPTNATGVGEDDTVATYTWTLSGLAEDDGFVISRIWAETNQTNENDGFDLEKMSFGGGHTIKRINGASLVSQGSINNPIDEENGDYNAYYLESADEDDPLATGSLLVYRETDEPDELDIKLVVHHDFATNESYDIRLCIRYLTPDGTDADLEAPFHIDEA